MPNVFCYSQRSTVFTESAPGRTSQILPLRPLSAGGGPSLQSQNQLLFPFIAFHKINIDIYYAKKQNLSTEFSRGGGRLSGTGIVLWGGGDFVCFLYAVRLQQTLYAYRKHTKPPPPHSTIPVPDRLGASWRKRIRCMGDFNGSGGCDWICVTCICKKILQISLKP